MTIALQAFKETDLKEAKVKDAFLPTLVEIDAARDAFYEGAYSAYPFGDVLFELGRSPLAAVITQETFRESFFAIHNLFTRPGTFEYYLEVLQAAFGGAAIITFEVPGPGRLNIEVKILQAENSTFLSRRIVDNNYIYDTVVDHVGDTLLFQGLTGVKTQSAADALIRELAPYGVYTKLTLTLGVDAEYSRLTTEDGEGLLTEDGKKLGGFIFEE